MHLQFIELRYAYFIIKHTNLTTTTIQGQTLSRVLFDVREDVFSHGALYVALSRVQKFSSISLITKKDKVLNDGGVMLKNIVYREVLV